MANAIKIKIIGVGGSGSNAVSRMMRRNTRNNIKGIECIIVNADDQDLKKSRAHQKIRIGKKLTRGLGTGMNPEIGKQAAEEQQDEIKKAVEGADMIFIACGLGGGTGSGATPLIAKIAKEKGALVIAVVTRPFSFEGAARAEIAEKSLKKIKENVDTLIVISNDKLFSTLEEKTTISNAFYFCDEILRQAVQGISDLIIAPGIINVDFADIKSIMKNSGLALFSIGAAKGDQRAKKAAEQALKSPLIDISCKGAKRILFNVSGGKDISLSEVEEVAKIITEQMSSSAKIIFGAIQDEKLNKDELRVTVIATGFN